MNSITNLLKSLSLQQQTKKRILVGFADTEGVPHRKDGSSSLWNLVVIFKYIVDEEFNQLEECMHVTHFAMPKNMDKMTVSKPLKTHISAINHIKEAHDCDDVVLGFWNAPHDNAVLNYYDALTDFKTVDLLKIAKDCSNNKFESYSIGKLSEQFNYQTSESIHTGLGDTIRMIKILPRVGISGVYKLKPYVNFDKKQTSNVKEKRHIFRNVPTTSKESEDHDGKCNDTTKPKEKSRITRSRTDKGIPAPKDNPRTRAIRRAKENNRIRKAGTGAAGAK